MQYCIAIPGLSKKISFYGRAIFMHLNIQEINLMFIKFQSAFQMFIPRVYIPWKTINSSDVQSIIRKISVLPITASNHHVICAVQYVGKQKRGVCGKN